MEGKRSLCGVGSAARVPIPLLVPVPALAPVSAVAVVPTPRAKVVLRAVVGRSSSANRSSLCESRLWPVRPRQLKAMPAAAPMLAQLARCEGVQPRCEM